MNIVFCSGAWSKYFVKVAVECGDNKKQIFVQLSLHYSCSSKKVKSLPFRPKKLFSFEINISAE